MISELDCLLVGHNQIPFEDYERTVRQMGTDSGAYRDLSMNTVRFNGKIWNPSDIFNTLCLGNTTQEIEPLRGVEVFSAAVAYLHTFLSRHGLRSDFVNSFQDGKDELVAKLTTSRVRTLAIITTLYITAFPIVEIVELVRRVSPWTKILVGGPFVTTKVRTLGGADLDDVWEPLQADVYVNSSQGEATLVKLVTALRDGTPLDAVENIHYRTAGGYAATPCLTEANPIEDNPVDWSLFGPGELGKFVNVRTAISCPFTCAFCGFPEHAGKYQYASVERVERELDNLAKHHPGVRNVTFTDDTFNVPPKRFKEMLRMMIRNDYPFTWSSFYRCQYADEESIALMKASKCESVFLGIESANPQVLLNMNKKATVDQYRFGVDLLQRHGIVTFANFVVGFPGETAETVDETIRFINESGIDFYRAQMWYCEHITPIWREREKYKIEGESFEWTHSTMDSATAADMVNHIILSVTNPTRLPQYYFDYDNVMQLTHKGLSIGAVKRFMRAYDDAVKEKFRNPSAADTSLHLIENIIRSVDDERPAERPSTGAAPIEDVEFDFFVSAT